MHQWYVEARSKAEAAQAQQGLLARVAKRDGEALTELVMTYDSEIVRFCYLVSGDPELARDATQNAWYRLWRDPPRMRDESRLRSWLLSVAANEARQMMRRRGIGRVREIEAASRTRVTDDTTDARLDLAALLRRLDPSERELLALRYGLELSSVDIGALLGLSAEGVRTRLHRLIGRLRRELGDE